MKLATYLRVSTEQKKQTDGSMKGQTVEPQRLELAAWAAARSTPITAEFSDIISGRKFNRDGLDTLLAAAARGEFDTVLIVKLDRIGRSISGVLALIEQLTAAGVAVIATSQGIDTSRDNPCGKLILHVLAACAEFERSLICERTRAGLAVARAAGTVLGRPSKTMVAEAQRSTIVAEWRAAGGRNYRALGVALGGVSGSTALRVARRYPAAAGAPAVMEVE